MLLRLPFETKVNRGRELMLKLPVQMCVIVFRNIVSAILNSLQHLARTLHPTLVSTLLDCVPTIFSPSSSPPETELQMIVVVCRICHTLYGRLLQDTAEVGLLPLPLYT